MYQLVTSGTMEVYTLLPMLWAGYNAIPAILFFIYWFNKGPLLSKICTVLQILGTLIACGAVAALWFTLPADYDLREIMPKTVTFMDAQRSGPLMTSTKSQFPWLEESGLKDRVIGGWYMTGTDYVKYTFPMASSVSFMAWSFLEFSKWVACRPACCAALLHCPAALHCPARQRTRALLGSARLAFWPALPPAARAARAHPRPPPAASARRGYTVAGQRERVLDNIRWGADYLMAAHTEEYQFIAQIGNPGDYYVNPDAGTGFWGRPSDMPRNRTAIRITLSSDGGADLIAAASAALSTTAMVFAGVDKEYADLALSHAAKLYDFALKLTPLNSSYCKVVPCYELSEGTVKQTTLDDGTNVTKVTEDGRYVKWSAFNSTSQFDDVAWAAAWLYRASSKQSFADDAEFYLRQHFQFEFKWWKKEHWATNWDNVGWATAMLLAKDLKSDTYRRNVTSYLRGWIRGNVEVLGAPDKAYPITFTKKGLAWQADTPLPNVAMTAMMGLIWAKDQNNGYDSRINNNIKCWSWGQVNYMLGGLMGKDMSYVVGYGNTPPKQPQHMQASCPGGEVCNVRSALLRTTNNPYQLTGALVAGPTANDNFDDVRTSAQNKVRPPGPWRAPAAAHCAGPAGSRAAQRAPPFAAPPARLPRRRSPRALCPEPLPPCRPRAQVGVHFNVALNAAMAGVMDQNLRLSDCQAGRGFYQSFFQPYSP